MPVQQDKRKLAARVGHTKSRTGCLKCRVRKVKCDEMRPVCANCQRLGLQCQFPSQPKSSTIQQDAGRRLLRSTSKLDPDATDLPTPQSTPDSNRPDDDGYVPRISKGTRMELRLLHGLMSRGVNPSAYIEAPEEWRQLWYIDVPRMALDHDNLLYALLAFSATQLLGLTKGDQELSLAQTECWALALRYQREAIVNPNHHGESTAIAARIIGIVAFGMLRCRVLEPYSPPVEWLDVARSVFRVCPLPEDYPPDWTLLRAITETTVPAWGQWLKEDMPLDVDEVYVPILSHRWSEEFMIYGGDQEQDLHAYRHTLALLTNFRQSLKGHSSQQANVWRVTMFPQTIPEDFVRFIRQERPRALVIAACVFVVIAQTKILKVFGDYDSRISRDEIQAIRKHLPKEWQGLMIKPLADMAAIDTATKSSTDITVARTEVPSADRSLDAAIGSYLKMSETIPKR